MRKYRQKYCLNNQNVQQHQATGLSLRLLVKKNQEVLIWMKSLVERNWIREDIDTISSFVYSTSNSILNWVLKPNLLNQEIKRSWKLFRLLGQSLNYSFFTFRIINIKIPYKKRNYSSPNIFFCHICFQ